VRRSAFLKYIIIVEAGKLGITFEVLLSFMSNVLNVYKLTKDSSIGLVMLFPFKMMVPSDITFFNVGDMVPNKPSFP
jgi:hypothetical protein